MPFLVTEKNVKKVFSEHLQEGENMISAMLAGARGVIGVTDKDRVYQTNFPFWGKSQIKEEFKVADITACDSEQKNSYTMVLNLTVNGENKSYKSTITPTINTIELMENFIKYIHSKNENTKPEYLDENEEIIDTIGTKKNQYKITNKNIIKLSKERELIDKTPFSRLKTFDFYPGKMDAIYLYFETKGGDKEILKIGGNAAFMASISGNDPFEMIEGIYEVIKKEGVNPYPDYIDDGEEMLATVRAGHSLMGLVNPAHVLKLTTKRLIDLKPNKEGKLEIDKILELDKVKSGKFTKVRGENGDIHYEVKLKMDDKSKHKFLMDGKYEYSIDKIREQINKMDSEDIE